MVSDKKLKLIEKIKKSDLNKFDNLYNLYQTMLLVFDDDNSDLEYCLKISKFLKKKAMMLHKTTFDENFQSLYYDVLLFEAQNHILDSYLIYLEKNRDPEDRFYLPRRTEFIKLGLVQALQDIIDDKLDILSLSLPPGVGKTTLEKMFVSGWIGWYPKLCNLFSSHSGHVTRMFYDAIQNIITNKEYAWYSVFPDVQIESMNAKEETINLDKFKDFKTLTCRAIGASQTGVTRCEGLLLCDDLCSGIEEALSKIRLDKLWTKYTADLKSRKKKKCKEIHIATRWSVWDVIGRIKRIYENNPRARFISVPDIDPQTQESNFDFMYDVGFDVAYFEDIEKSLDDITYKCLYKSEPVEREGILYDPDVVRRYGGTLPPNKEPDAIWAFCDTKDTGKDYNCLGVFYQYGTDYYLADVVFQSIDPYVLDELNGNMLLKHNVQIAEFESNKEGGRTADKVQEYIEANGGRCSIQKKFTTQNKETKIIVNSPWVIKHVLFLNPDCYEVKSDYGQFMSWLCAYSQLAKNPHDDAPDMVSMLAAHESSGFIARAEACERLY